MALIPYNRNRNISPFDGFFDDDFWFPTFRSKMRGEEMGTELALDVYEKDDQVVAEMNLPGMDVDDIDISVNDGVLSISGERSEESETEDKEKQYYAKQIRRGAFSRSIRLPSNVNADKANAEYEDGVLRVFLPTEQEETEEVKRIGIDKK